MLPESQADHAKLAIKAALEGQTKMTELLQRRIRQYRNVQFGIGINTGKALAGNVGSLGRAEYTVIGDEVNLASRICSVTPGGEIYIGPETYNQIAAIFFQQRRWNRKFLRAKPNRFVFTGLADGRQNLRNSF